MAVPGKTQPRRVQYRVGLGLTVSLLLASAVGLVAWASFTNTHKAILELTDEQVREVLTGLDLRVRDHLQSAVTAAELSEKLLSNTVLRKDQDVLALHFTEVLRANPTFAWAGYSDAMGDFTGRLPRSRRFAAREPNNLEVERPRPRLYGGRRRRLGTAL